ncbi:MAG: SsrA-binding protein SmpB [bacterium]|nr:SsrA-binding protein SmpB [bacterium]
MGDQKILIQNKKAWHEYFIEDRYEAGMVLTGTEVKSLRNCRANLGDSYAKIKNGEIWLCQAHISPYKEGNIFNHDPLRNRKLLLHKQQIAKLFSKTEEKGYSLIPTKIYLSNGRIKIEIALAKGKKLYDKRDSLTAKQAKKDIRNI